jgi:serine/threonine protein kinase/Tfp pilus assembly protein PilF
MTNPGMTPARFQMVRAHFEAALDASPGDLEAWLAARIPDDAALRHDVRTLVRAHLEDSLTLVSPFSAAGVLDAGTTDRTGDRVGAWTVVRQIGAGGMGTVYEAHRAEGEFDQRAAIKFLRRSVEGESAKRRFRTERQILANLHHPNIAALLDGGVTPDGQPYFVMEFVDGRPITTWCEERALDLRGRLVLFLQVCAAVQHAHQALVIHRDLKPGNILVTDQGTVKLLDFGIATLLRDDEDPGEFPPTQGNARLFTPDYAAPEQVRGLGVATTTDVYALGVVLFELLTGQRPLQLRGKSMPELEEAICHQQPPLPSASILGTQWQRLGTGSARQAAQRLAGDLDAIVLTALRKEPERRYGSADQLARDLRAYLDGMPVTARPDGVSYRLGKFIRRRRIELAAGGVAVAALLGGIVVSRAKAQEAERERNRAQDITAFLTDMLIAPDPSALGRDVTMREVLDSAAVQADSLHDRPALEREIRGVIGGTYIALGEYARAIVEFEKALAAARREAPESRVVASATARLAGAHEQAGDYPAADSLLDQALAMLDRLGTRADAETVDWLDQRGRVLARLGQFRESEPLFRRAVQLLAAAEPRNDSATGAAWHNLAMVTSEIGQNDSSDAYFRRALDLERGVLGADHPLVLSTRVAHATVLQRLGRIEEAMRTFEEVIEARRRVLGADHPDYAWSLFNYADFLLLVGRNVEAAERARDVLALRGRSLPETHLAVSTSMQVLGRALSRLDSLDAAEHWLRESLRLRTATLPAGHWILASSRSVLGEHFTNARRFGDAEAWLLDAERELVELRGDEAQPVRDTRQRLVDLYVAWGKPQQAAAWREKLDAPTP